MISCKWCKDTGKILLVDNYVNCTECEKGKQKELSEKKVYSFYNDIIRSSIITPSPKPTIIQSEKKDLFVPIIPTPIRRKSSYYGYSETTPRSSWDPTPTVINPSVIGNAGIPGCGTGTIQNNSTPKILFTSEEIPIGYEFQFEILAGRAGAFKPRSVQIIGRCLNDFDVYKSIKILNLSIFGIPQFSNYQKSGKYLDSEFFKNETMIDWSVFGSDVGQGLQWIVYNPHYTSVSLSIMIKGDPASMDLIGI